MLTSQTKSNSAPVERLGVQTRRNHGTKICHVQRLRMTKAFGSPWGPLTSLGPARSCRAVTRSEIDDLEQQGLEQLECLRSRRSRHQSFSPLDDAITIPPSGYHHITQDEQEHQTLTQYPQPEPHLHLSSKDPPPPERQAQRNRETGSWRLLWSRA